MGLETCRNIVLDGYEFICADTGEVLNPHEVPHLELQPSSSGSQRADSRRGLIDTYMVPKSREEEDARFYKLVKAQTRVKYGRILEQASRVFDDVAGVVRSHFPSIPQQVLDEAKRDFMEIMAGRRFVTKDIARRYAVVSLYYWLRRRGVPLAYREYLRVFPREGLPGFMRIYRELEERNGRAVPDYSVFISKALSYLGLEGSGEIMREAVEIAERVRRVRSFKPNILAVASVIYACDKRGVKIRKTELAKALGVRNYYRALGTVKALLSHGAK